MSQILNSKIGVKRESLDNVAAIILINAATVRGGEHIAGLMLVEGVSELARRYNSDPGVKDKYPQLFSALAKVSDVSDAGEIAQAVKDVKPVAYTQPLQPNPFRMG